MNVRELIVVEPGRIEVQESELDEQLQPHEALVEAEYSVVSAGTEGAGFTGLVKNMPFGDAGQYPRSTGYGHLGQVLAVGEHGAAGSPGSRRRTPGICPYGRSRH